MAAVVVTRPEPGASATAKRLRAAGHRPVRLPLSRTVALPAHAPSGAVDAVALTSAAALRHAPARLVAPFLHLPCFAVGQATAASARAAGFGDVRAGEGDASALAALVRRDLPRGGRILYLCGRVRRAEFEAALAAGGFAVLAAETYDTAFVVPDVAAMSAALEGEPPRFVLLYSVRAAETLAAALLSPEARALFDSTQFLCLSSAVAGPIRSFAPARVGVAARPDEDALMELLGAA